MIFASVTRDGVMYEIQGSDSYRDNGFYKCPGAYLGQEIVEYLTYGDGSTQHSHSSIVSVKDFFDCLASLATYLQDNPDEVDRVSSVWPHQDWTDKISFAMGIKYNEKKPEYVSVDLQKTSKSEKLRWDKRWELIPSWADGSMEITFKWTCESHYSALYRFSLYEQIRKAYRWETFEGSGIGSTDNYDKLSSAFHAVDSLVMAYHMSEGAKRTFACLKSNWLMRQGQEETLLVEDLNALPIKEDLE